MIMMTIMNFYFLMLISIILSLSINSNFLMWLSLELNMLSFLPIMSSKMNFELENAMKYFLVQSWASIIFLLSFFFMSHMYNLYMLMMMSMFMKLGVAPFHVWFISILKTSSMYILIMLSSIQKIIPLLILSNIKINLIFLLFFLMLNILFTIFMLPSTISLNKILALSSMNNIGWMIMSIMISMKLFFMFMFMYLYLLSGFMILYKTYKINLFMQMNSMNFFDKMMTILLFMSLGGLPPLLGFLSKFLIIKFMLMSMNYIFCLVLIFSSLYLLYFYLSRMYFFLSYSPSLKMTMKMNYMFFKKTMYLLSLMSINTLFMFL